MAKNEQKKVSRIKTRKKIWHKILSTPVFGKKEIGESYLGSASEAQNRCLKVNLKDLTNNLRDQNAYVSFQINKWQGTTLETIHTGYELTPASIKRMVKKNSNRLDDYFVFTSKDGKQVVIKTLMLTLHKVARSIQVSLRRELKNLLSEEFQKNSFDVIFGNVIAYKIQPLVKKKLAKIYPLKEVAIRKFNLVSITPTTVTEAVEPKEVSTSNAEPSTASIVAN